MAKYRFVNWGGDITGTDNPISGTMPTMDMTIIANYTLATRKLNFSSTPIPVQVSVKVGVNAPVPLNSGQSMNVPEGETILVTAPTEVTT